MEPRYVLRRGHSGNFLYYTGKRPATSLFGAKRVTEERAKGIRRFAYTGPWYKVRRVSDQDLFQIALMKG